MICRTIGRTLKNKVQPETKIKFYNILTTPVHMVMKHGPRQEC